MTGADSVIQRLEAYNYAVKYAGKPELSNEQLFSLIVEANKEHIKELDVKFRKKENLIVNLADRLKAKKVDVPERPVKQARAPMSIQESEQGVDFLKVLPREVSTLVFALLDFPDALRAASVCRAWRAHIHNGALLERMNSFVRYCLLPLKRAEIREAKRYKLRLADAWSEGTPHCTSSRSHSYTLSTL